MSHDYVSLEKRIADYARQNTTRIVSVILVICCAVAALWFYQRNRELKNTRAWAQLIEARAITELESLLEAYPGTSAVPMALMQLGKLYQRDSEWQNACDAYRRILDSYPNFEYVDYALLNYGKALLALKDYTAARETFERILGKSKDEWLALDTRLQLALLDEKENRKDEAIERYKELFKSDVVFFRNCAEIRLVKLGVLRTLDDAKKIRNLKPSEGPSA